MVLDSTEVEKKKVAVHLILQGGKFLKNVSQLVSLPSPVVSVDLDQATERLWGEETRYNHRVSTSAYCCH